MLSVIGGALLIVGILRLVLFTKAYREQKEKQESMKKDSISVIRDGVFFCMRTYGDRDFFTVMEWYFF